LEYCQGNNSFGYMYQSALRQRCWTRLSGGVVGRVSSDSAGGYGCDYIHLCAAEEEITDADIEELDIPELKKMCRDLKLSDEGGVNALRGRLISHLFPPTNEDENGDEDDEDDVDDNSCDLFVDNHDGEIAGEEDGGNRNNSNEAEERRILSLTVLQLKEELRVLGKKVSGKKADLQERLLDARVDIVLEDNESDGVLENDDDESGEGGTGELEDGDDEVYSFESIETHKITGGVYTFKVLWTSGVTTWEPAVCLEDCTAFTEYLEAHGLTLEEVKEKTKSR